MANNETITGIVKAVRKDKKGILIGEKWYSNKFMDETKAQKGDEVEVTLNEKGYLDQINIKSSKPKRDDYNTDTRPLVDTGNILERATELTIAVINKADNTEKNDLPALLEGAVTECLKQFKRIHKGLTETEEQEPKQE